MFPAPKAIMCPHAAEIVAYKAKLSQRKYKQALIFPAPKTIMCPNATALGGANARNYPSRL